MLDIEYYKHKYFIFDKPCIYKKGDKEFTLYPISLEDSEDFLEASKVISIDKNSLPSVDIIQMSYLKFICAVLVRERKNIDNFATILKLSLHMYDPKIGIDVNNKYVIFDEEADISITEKEFEDIRRLILYQNILSFDDSYIDPDLKKAIDETNELRSKDIDFPDIERKMAIITSHCGIRKSEQQKMTYRAHTMLWNEVCADIDFSTSRSIALLSGEKIEHWIYKKKKDKMDDYIISGEKFADKLGANFQDLENNAKVVNVNSYEQKFNKMEEVL